MLLKDKKILKISYLIKLKFKCTYLFGVLKCNFTDIMKKIYLYLYFIVFVTSEGKFENLKSMTQSIGRIEKVDQIENHINKLSDPGPSFDFFKIFFTFQYLLPTYLFFIEYHEDVIKDV